MARNPHIEYPGALFHAMHRGDQREDIFRQGEDRQKFLCTLGEACGVSNLLSELPDTLLKAQKAILRCQLWAPHTRVSARLTN